MRERVQDFQASNPRNLTDMSLWVDKCQPCSLGQLDYYKDQVAQLCNLVQCGNFTHLLVYGPSGAGKKTELCVFYMNFMVLEWENWELNIRLSQLHLKIKLKLALLQAITTLKLISVMLEIVTG